MMMKEIVLDKDALLYEIENTVDKISRSRLRDDNLEQSIQVQADETEQDRAITVRSVNNSINVIRTRMGAYISNEDAGDEVVKLQFPEGRKECVFPDLVGSIREYVINIGVFEWLRVTLPQEAQGYRERAEECLDRVKSCVTARVAGSVRRPLQPF